MKDKILKYLEPYDIKELVIYGSYIEYKYGLVDSYTDIDCLVCTDLDVTVPNTTIDGIDIEFETVSTKSYKLILNKAEPKMLFAEYSTFYLFDLLKAVSLSTVRSTISTVCSQAYNKGKKKLTIESDYDQALGLKNIWHSIKFAFYAKWLYHSFNEDDIYGLCFIHDKIYELYDGDFEVLNAYMKPLFNAVMTDFRLYFPKG